jgi:hypothetical protein
MEQPSSAVKSLAFRPAKLPLPLPLILVAAAGTALWFVGSIGSRLCDHGYCGKNSNLLGAIFGIMSGVGNAITLVSGVSVAGYLIIAAAQANIGGIATAALSQAAEYGLRMSQQGMAWTASHRTIPSDIEAAFPEIHFEHLD